MVLWIDQNKLATSLFEKVFKSGQRDFYSLSEAKDFAYLVDDLRPHLIVLDASTAMKDLEAVKNQYAATDGFFGIPVSILDEVPGLEFIRNRKPSLTSPIDPFTLPQVLDSL